jgi:hypothetical protein
VRWPVPQPTSRTVLPARQSAERLLLANRAELITTGYQEFDGGRVFFYYSRLVIRRSDTAI